MAEKSMPQPSTPSSIVVRIENTQPVELIDFTRSLLSLGDQFKREIEAKSDEMEVKLYVKELRPGSLVAELAALDPNFLGYAAGAAYASMEYANTVGDFIEHTRALIDWLRGRGDKPAKADAPSVKNAIAIVEPVAKDNGANITISISGNNNNAPIIINNIEANAVQNRGMKFLEVLKEPTSQVQEKKLMYWHQVRNEDGPASGEKAIIEAISNRPIKVIFDSRKLREEMLYSPDNPLKEAYVVDVDVQTVRGKIAAYKILQLHDRVKLDDDTPSSQSPEASVPTP